MKVFSWLIVSLLILFTARRYLYWVASCFPRKPRPAVRESTIAVLIAARNEEALLPRLLLALDRVDYPRELLSFVLISDGSTDATARMMQEWCSGKASARVVDLSVRVGKATALAHGVKAARLSDLVVVMDADTEPTSVSFAHLAGAFADPQVGAASGYPAPGNADDSIVSRYAAMERWVFHLVTQAGKERLGLNPPLIGALLAIRWQALLDIGGFPADTVAEDICLSMAVSNKWRTRWVREAVVREDVPVKVRDFLRQRARWNRGLLASGRSAGRLEDLFVAAGYIDRLVLAVAFGLSVAGWIPVCLPLLYVVSPLVMVVTALLRAGAKRQHLYLVSLGAMAFVDVVVTAVSALSELFGQPVSWRARNGPAVSP